MANFSDHVSQAKKNIEVLKGLNKDSQFEHEWQITVAYYVALHLLHAFIADKSDLHPTNHNYLKGMIEPGTTFSNTELEDNVYSSYAHLEILSRKSRYLCVGKANPEKAVYATNKDFQRSIQYLDKVICFFEGVCNETIESIDFEICESKYTKELKKFSVTFVPEAIS